MNVETLVQRARCYVRLHDWKRAVRVGGAASLVGRQRCKHCSASRDIALRPVRSVKERATEATTTTDGMPPRSHWPLGSS